MQRLLGFSEFPQKLCAFAGLPVARKLFPDEIRALGDENMMEGTKPTFSGGFLPTCMF